MTFAVCHRSYQAMKNIPFKRFRTTIQSMKPDQCNQVSSRLLRLSPAGCQKSLQYSKAFLRIFSSFWMFASNFNKILVLMFLSSYICKVKTCISKYSLHCIHCIYHVFSIIMWIFFMKLVRDYDTTVLVSFVPLICQSFISLTKGLTIRCH